MRFRFAPVAFALGLALGAPVQARDLHINHESCGYETPYDVQVDAAGIRFERADGAPNQVFMHDGRLRVDGRDVAVSTDDAARLRQYEDKVRALLPEVAGIAREGVEVGFAAMRVVTMTFAESESERRELVGRLDRRRAQALADIDGSLGRGVWKHEAISESLSDSVQESVGDLVGKVTGSAVSAALSGDKAKVAALEARADSLDKSIDKEINVRADHLSQRAQALCPRLQALDGLQQQFQFRLADGSRLQLVRWNKDDNNKVPAKKEPDVASR
ncbi:DUF2884 family protein [Dyella sp. BiH032]|uniref:DUF2884 family protein n=1 Tax=Dyella sp. BiH032 TaxID=3075430 RepID=UPI00289326C9|nr:DUF2884 family protein [Dyella sp. BiH032]WNL46836.1 DUF2884 family protein [Dyella sp. BiH032]